MESQQPATHRSTDTKTLHRAMVVCGIIAVLFIFLLVRILFLQTVEHEKYRDKVLNQLTTEVDVLADRGKIYDRNGVLLATNITTYRVFIAPRTIAAMNEDTGKDYANRIATELSSILDVSYDLVLKQTTYTKYLDRTVARQVDEDTAKLVKELINREEWQDMVFLQAGTTRYYPQGTVACHLLGFTGDDGKGQYGIELQYDSVLAGTNGKYITARDSRGNEMPYEYQSYIEAQDGNSLILTIDVNIQKSLEEQLRTTYLECEGQERACGVVTDPDTGEVLAMAVYPPFNPNEPRTLNDECQRKLDDSGLAEGTDEYNELKQELQLETWANKVVGQAYYPGSTFKTITTAMAYEEDLVDDFNNSGFCCNGYHIVGGRRIKCAKLQGHGPLTFDEALQYSCNPAMMIMGAKIGGETFYEYIQAFGYLEKTGIDLPGETGSNFWSHDDFVKSSVNLAVASFGQNFEISPLQQIMAVSAVANGGYLMTPYVVKEIQDRDGNVLETRVPEVRRQVISAETSRQVSSALEAGVAGNGGASTAYVAGYRVAAKTGTSEKILKMNEKDDGRNYYVSSTVGYAPANDPEIAVLIIVDEPTAGISLYGSFVAAPYVGKVVETALPYMGVAAQYTDKELANLTQEVPDVVGWSASAAETYASSFGLTVEIVGEGSIVRSQSPAAGTKLEPTNGKIILYMERDMAHETVTVPDVTGLTAVSANALLAGRGLNIRIKGTNSYLSGTAATAVSQDIAPNTVVEKGTVITVTFYNKDLEADNLPDADEILG